MRVRVTGKASVATDVVSLELRPVANDGLAGWSPGAHLDLHAGNGSVRQYSLCGDPADSDSWRVAVLRVPDGRGGSAWFHDELAVGDELDVSDPRNHFQLEPAPSYQFIAGGIGITPILPMVSAADAMGTPWRLTYGGRTRSSMAFLDELAEYGDSVTVAPQDESGLIDLPAVLGDPVPGRRIYCCGPEPLLAAVEAAMRDRTEEHLHVERFQPIGDLNDPGEPFDVELRSSGVTVHVGASQSIVDALADAGIEVEFSCREGTCGTCETGVLGGEPEHRDSVLSEDEKAANDCMMICVGRCLRGPLVLDL